MGFVRQPSSRRRAAFDNRLPATENDAVSKLEILETEVRNLPREEAFKLQDWLADFLEDQAELNPEFVASIERGKAALCEAGPPATVMPQ